MSAVCSGGFCAIPTCTDLAKNAQETDIDCGGGTCGACVDGKSCAIPGDCLSNVCMSNMCVPSACNDTVKNGSETDIDCGGPACLKCADTKSCSQGTDCQSAICNGNKCAVPTCMDVTKNGKETDVDCGGGTCAKCIDGKACSVATDCTSSVCTGNKCQVPTCMDLATNGTETDVDCGGSCATKCMVTKACLIDTDCASSTCFNKVCVNTPTFTSVTPNMGPTTGNTPVTLNGTNFFPVGMAATSVTFGGTAGTVPQVTAATTATAMTPARLNQVGLVNVVLTLPGNHSYTLTNGFRYYYGQLGFNAPVAVNNTIAHGGMAVADVDNDGDMDVIAARPATGSVAVLINNGAGTFVAANYPTTTGPTRLATADFDGNGLVDVAVTHTNGIVVVMFNSAAVKGTFPTRTPTTVAAGAILTGVVAVDVDGVNRADILVTDRTNNRVSLLKNGGGGTFVVTANYPMGVAVTTPLEMASGDFNADGRQDVVFTSATTVNTWSCLNMAGTSFACTANTSFPTSDVRVADINSDGKQDFVLTAVGNPNVFAYTGNGAGAFNQVATNGIAGNWTSLQLVDINKDTYTDIVFSNSAAGANQVGVALGRNDGTFQAGTAIRALTAAPGRVVVGQFNTGVDQKDDFAVSTTSGVNISLSNAQ